MDRPGFDVPLPAYCLVWIFSSKFLSPGEVGQKHRKTTSFAGMGQLKRLKSTKHLEDLMILNPRV